MRLRVLLVRTLCDMLGKFNLLVHAFVIDIVLKLKIETKKKGDEKTFPKVKTPMLCFTLSS